MMIDIHENCPFCRGRINDQRHAPLGGDCPVRDLGEHQVTASEARERLEREAAAAPEDRYMSVEWLQADERRIEAHRRLMAEYLAEIDKLQDYERPPLRAIAGGWIDGAEGGNVGNLSNFSDDELVMVAADPVRVAVIELFDHRTFYAMAEMGDDAGLSDMVMEIGRRACADCYTHDELAANAPASRMILETWERARFQALPDEKGYGRIIDNVWPADALRIRGACPRTGGHHRPADRGRYCRKCGRSREE